MNSLQYKNADEARQAGLEWIKNSNRWDKICYLRGCSSSELFDNTLLCELVDYMGQDDFNEFFEYLQHKWDIKTPQELDFVLDLSTTNIENKN